MTGPRGWRRWVATAAAAGLLTQTVWAGGGGAPPASGPERPRAEATPATPLTRAEVRLEIALATAQAQIAGRLVELGRRPEDARAAAMALTADDIRVLLEHPRMLQPAAGVDNVTMTFIIGALIVAGIIVAAAASDGSASFVTNP